MKTPVTITIIIVGGLILVAPLVADYLERAQVAEAMARPGVTSVNLRPTLSEEYRLGCWLVGGAMIAAAILFSARGGSERRPSPPPQQ